MEHLDIGKIVKKLKDAGIEKEDPLYKEVFALIRKAEDIGYDRDDQEDKLLYPGPDGESSLVGAVLAGCLSVIGGGITWLFAQGYGKNKMAEQYLEIRDAQQEYASQVAADFYNEFGHMIYPATPDNLIGWISHYAHVSDDPLASMYLNNYASEVQNTLNQIAIEVVGVDYGMMAINIGVGVGLTLFASHIVGATTVKFCRIKKIRNCNKKIGAIDKQIDEKITNYIKDNPPKNTHLVALPEQEKEM